MSSKQAGPTSRRDAQEKRETRGKTAAKPETHLSQREKFIQAAREAGCDETGEALDEALRAIGRARKQPS